MARQLLFVQGGGGENAHDAWDSKLVAALDSELGPAIDLRYPRLPDEAHPAFAPWSAALRSEFDALDAGAILAGHSIGAAILVHTLARHAPLRPPAGLFLISVPFIGEGGWESDDIAPEPNLGAVLPKGMPVFLYQGDADETVPVAHGALNAGAIPQATLRVLTGRDHQLNNDMSDVAADIRALLARLD